MGIFNSMSVFDFTRDESSDALVVQDVDILNSILEELKLTNMYLSLLTDVTLEKGDPE